MPTLPVRGDGSNRPPGLALPPDRMPWRQGSRPLKRWRYLGVFGAEAMVCAAQVRVAGVPHGFWAVWDRSARTLSERTARRCDRVHIDPRAAHAPGIELALHADGEAVDVVSAHGGSYIWTRKQPVRAVGRVRAGEAGRPVEIDARGVIDDSAGYHARHTSWRWSSGVGSLADGRAVTWNVVDGLHDSPAQSERTLWLDGAARELAPVTFGDELDGFSFGEGGALAFTGEAMREHRERLVLAASAYRQPFGTFAGTLPGGLTLAQGFGVMESHDVRW